jgi:enoyl-CoA hydratase/carnithine racemase
VDRRPGQRHARSACHASRCRGEPLSARYDIDGGVAEIVIDHGPLNLWDPDLIADVEDGVARAAAERPRSLIVRAEGDVFSAGVDVHVFEGLDAQSATALTGRLLALTHALEDLPLPTLAVVHGLCLTAGLELSLACDLMWAAEGVQFGLVEKVVGITPLMGGTQRMAERAGTARAREFVMTGRLYDAQTLHAWGVVNRVVAPADLLDKSRRFAAGLAAGPTVAHAATKAIVRAQADHGTRGADERTAALTSHLFETDDCRNAVQSFLREGPGKATFTGKL